MACKNNLGRRAHAVNVGGAVCDDEVTRINHATFAVNCRPELLRAAGSLGSPFLIVGKGPVGAGDRIALVLATIFVNAAHIRLKPGVEYGHAEPLQELADAIPPAKLLLLFS